MKVGVLALQGGVEEHVYQIKSLGHTPILVKKKEDLEGLDRLILPGGESTTIGKLLRVTGLLEPLKNKIERGLKTFGTCAGMILLAKNIEGGEKAHLQVLDVSVRRNGFGSQIDSFKKREVIKSIDKEPMELVFIRAPYIEKVGKEVLKLCEVEGRVVAVKQNNILATAFHPELTNDIRIMKYFIEKM